TLVSAGRRAGPGGLASIHDSGGERAMIVDLAARSGVPFADISAATRSRLGAVLEPGLPPVNPLDAWGTGNASEEIFAECIRAVPPAAPPGVRTRWLTRLRRSEPLGEAESLALLADYGVPVLPAREASSAEQAGDAADALGWPVALKNAAPGVLHKSDVGGVLL